MDIQKVNISPPPLAPVQGSALPGVGQGEKKAFLDDPSVQQFGSEVANFARTNEGRKFEKASEFGVAKAEATLSGSKVGQEGFDVMSKPVSGQSLKVEAGNLSKEIAGKIAGIGIGINLSA